MKRLQRTILGIIRRPLKSLILLMVVFVMGNVISGSLILYNTSQSIKDEVMNQSAPIIRIRTPIDVGSILNPDDIYNNSYSEDERMKFIMQEVKAYQEIFDLPEVKYADYGIKSNWDTNDKNSTIVCDADNLEANLDNTCKISTEISVNRPDFYHLQDNQIRIVEGRTFTQEEIEQGKPVALVPNRLLKRVNGKLYIPYQVGEKITLTNQAYSKSVYYSDLNLKNDEEMALCLQPYSCECTQEQINKINQEISDSLVVEKSFEVEIIGIYEITDYDKYYNVPHYYSYHSEPLVYLPGKTFRNNKELFLKEVQAYEEKHSTQLYSNVESFTQIIDNKTRNAYTYILLNDPSDIPAFTQKATDILKKYELEDYKLDVNMDLYLQIAGPLAALQEVAQYMIVVSIVVAFIILSAVSIIFLKERRKEMAILLSLGEAKKHVVLQMFVEVLIIGMIGIGCSMITIRPFSTSLSNRILDNYHPAELTEEQKEMLPDNLTPKAILSQYETQLAGADITSVMGVSGLILIISSGCSLFVLLKTKPKDLLN